MPPAQCHTAIITLAAIVLFSACDPSTQHTVKSDQPRAAPDPAVAPAELDCRGSELPSCPPGSAGLQCDLACAPGFDECDVHYYCHADGRVLGLGASGTYLFPHVGVESGPAQVRQALESWISTHEVDLGFPDGLTVASLDIEPTERAEVSHGLLKTYRFHQYYDASGRRALVVGDASMITVEANAFGVLSVKGTIIDPRVAYAYSASQATRERGRASIQRYVALREGIPWQDVEVLDLGVVAVPGANVMGWRGTARINGQVSLATVIVEADPDVVEGALPLVQYQDHTLDGLANTVGIDVVSEDLGSDINTLPIIEATVSTLFDGTPLLGSIDDVSMDPQLATEQVVTLDLHGGELFSVMGAADFDRFTDVAGDFDETQPSLGFAAQRYHHLALEAYALVDHVTIGAWDSALPRFTKTVPDPMNPMNTIDVPRATDYPPGQFRPRILNATNYASLGGPTGQATYAYIGTVLPIPEIFQQPAPGQESEVVAYVKLPPGSAAPHVFFHEIGHAFDVFLAPGRPDDFIPACTMGCDTTCDEDTSDEALPLAETIAQLFALWQYQRIAEIPQDDCGIIAAVMTSTGQGSTLVHHPNCMDELDQISMFVRPDDPECMDPDFCDKPSLNETDALIGPPYVCDATEGYNVTSMLQVWWNALYGQSCAPIYPFTCSSLLDVEWPPGCDDPTSTTTCATADEVVGLALVYATRTNPLSYKDFLDAMANFVACNYGGDAYLQFNDALCAHRLRDCDEPPPAVCDTCGNGIREGAEACDGLDLSVPELGVVPTCLDFGFAGGTLLCDASCGYDSSQCVAGTTSEGLDSTATGGSPSTDAPLGSSSGDSESTGTAGAGGGGGCECSTHGRRHHAPWLVAFVLGLGMRRRMRRSSTPHPRSWLSGVALLGLGLLFVSAPGCGPGDDAATAAAGDTSSGEATTDATASSAPSTTGEPPDEWPADSYGAFRSDVDVPLGVPGMYIVALSNLELASDGLRATHLGCDGDTLLEAYAVTYEDGAAHVRPRAGETHVMWRETAIAKELVFRPGATCDTLETELVEPLPGYEEPWRWRRGGLVVTDSCGASDDVWAFDLSPDVATACPPAG